MNEAVDLKTLAADEIGDAHLMSSVETPMRADAFLLSEEQKMEKIAGHFEAIMETLGLDLTDDSLQGTPQRVAKMYVKEIFSGLLPENKPRVAVFENKYKYKEMLVEKNIELYSTCEHHFLPIVGRAHVAYISNGNVIGLSKINRIVQYYAKRPQVQERLVVQITKALQEALGTEDVAVLIEGKHLCVASRGIEDTSSSTITAEYTGAFKDRLVRDEFLTYVKTDLM